MQKKIENILDEMALKYNLPVQVIEQVYMSQWKALKDSIRSLEFKTIKLPAWGKYVPSRAKLEKIDYTEKRKRIEDKKNETKENSK